MTEFHIGPILRAQILVAVVLLLKWSSNLPPIKPRFHLLDLFAGGAAASKVWQLAEPIIFGSTSSSFHKHYLFLGDILGVSAVLFWALMFPIHYYFGTPLYTSSGIIAMHWYNIPWGIESPLPFTPVHEYRSSLTLLMDLVFVYALACSGVLVATAALPSMRCTARGKGPWTSYHLLGGCFLGHYDVRLSCTNWPSMGMCSILIKNIFQWLAQVGSLGHPMRIPRVCELDGSRVWVVGIAGPSYLYENFLQYLWGLASSLCGKCWDDS